jgi:hypothetical protein
MEIDICHNAKLSSVAAEYESLKAFGFTVLKNSIPSNLLDNVRNQLEKQMKEEIANNNLLCKQDDQIILRNVFQKAPQLYLPLLDLAPVNAILASIFNDGYTLQSMNASRSNPIGERKHDLRAHIDSRLPAKGIEHTLGIGVAFCVDDFNEANGATRVWPFSHLSGLRPEVVLESGLTLPFPVIVEANAGDIIVFLSQLWHAVGPNRTDKPRWGIFSFFNPWWIKPTWDYKDCGEEMYNLLSENQKQLFGFNTQVPSMNSPRVLTKTKIDDLPSDYERAKNIG